MHLKGIQPSTTSELVEKKPDVKTKQPCLLYSLGKELTWKQVTCKENCVMHVNDSDLAIELRKLKSDVHMMTYLC